MKSSPPENDLPHLATGEPAATGQGVLERRRRLVAELLPADTDHLLDFGCGNGAQTQLLLPHCRRLSGVDINEGFLADFRRSLAVESPNIPVELLASGGGPVPLPDGSVDVAVSFTVLEHVPDEAAVLADLHRLVRPGGRLILSVPNRWWIFETHGADLPLLPWNRVPFVSWWPKSIHDRWARARIYRRGEIRSLVEEAGFRVTEIFHMTAPMDMLRPAWARSMARKFVFGNDRASLPFLATEIFVVAER